MSTDPQTTGKIAAPQEVAPDSQTLCFLATARDTSARDALSGSSVFDRVSREAEADYFLRVHTPLPKCKPDGSPLPTLPAPHGAPILLRGPLAHNVERFGAFLGFAAPLLDLERSVLTAGPEYVIKPADLPVLVVVLVARKPEDDRASFEHRWLHRHATFGLRMPAPGYSQIHLRDIHQGAELPTGLSPVAGFDGFATVSYATRANVAPPCAPLPK